MHDMLKRLCLLQAEVPAVLASLNRQELAAPFAHLSTLRELINVSFYLRFSLLPSFLFSSPPFFSSPAFFF